MVLLAASLGACGAWAATYYVDSTKPSAGDQKPGTADQPFKSVQRAAELAKPGDQIVVGPEPPPRSWYVDQTHPLAADTNAGTEAAPFTTIQAAADKVQPGDTVKVKPGRYRESVIVAQCGAYADFNDGLWTKRRVTFEAVGGAAILDGSMRVPADAVWKPAEGRQKVSVARVDLPVLKFHRGQAPAAVTLPDPQWVFVDEELLLPNVKKPGVPEMPGDSDTNRWYWDAKQSRLYLNLGARKPGPGVAVDISAHFHAFGWKPTHYTTIRGFTIQRYSHGAIYGDNREIWVEDCLFRHNKLPFGGGIGGHVVRCAFLDNDGTAVYPDRRMLCAENILIRFYLDTFRTRNYYNSCGIKTFSSDTFHTFRNNVIVDDGPRPLGYWGIGGIWFDNPSPGNFVYGNTIANVGMGMYIEYPMVDGLLTWNVISDVNEGIVLRHNAANHVIENYVCRARDRGIKLQNTERQFPPLVKYNFFAGNYLEDCGIGMVAGAQPGGGTQALNMADGNIYNLKAGQQTADWAGTIYGSLETFQKGTGMEAHSRVGMLAPDEAGLVSFRIADCAEPWKVRYAYGNPTLQRHQWNRGEWGDMKSKTFPGIPYFFMPGVGDGSVRTFLDADKRADWPRTNAVSADKHPVGLSWYYTSTAPFSAVVCAATENGWMKCRNYMNEELELTGHDVGGKVNNENPRLQVLSRGPEGAPPEGLGWFSASMPTAPGAVIDIGLWMFAQNVKPMDKHGPGGAMVMVEWSDYTRAKVARSFIVGCDDEGKDHSRKLVTGSFDYTRVEGNVTAPDWAKRFRLFMGLRSATGILQFDDIDTIHTRPGQAPAGQEEKERVAAPPVDPATLTFTILDLSKLVNRSLADDAADDGRGGWTDDGPSLDMRGIAAGEKLYQSVPFRILAPLSCVVLKSPARKPGDLSDKVTIPVDQRAAMLCFLHAVAGSNGVEQARYVITYADGSQAAIPLVAGKNIRHWTDAADVLSEAGQWRAYAADSVGGPIYPRQSIWVLEWRSPKPDQTIKSIEFVGSGNGVPILMGITLGQRK
jgi:hypothetical protein